MFLVGKVFDDSFNLRRIIDVYSSFIWNEYYIGYSDFQLRFPMTDSALDYIKEGWYLGIAQSDKLMFIEKIGIETDAQNGDYAVIEGRSLESVLLRRFIRNDMTLDGKFQTGIMRLVQSNMLTAAASNRRINRVTFTPSNDQRITALTVNAEYTAGDELYDAVVGLCEYERVGFKVVPNYEDGTFEATLYMGQDRSYKQDTLPWVVFSSKYENLKSSNMSVDTRELKNAAIIENNYTITLIDEDGNSYQKEVTLIEEVGANITDLERRELFISCSISPDEVDKDKFGKATDRVNIRDYQEYMLLKFDSRGYREACAAVDSKYSSSIDRPGTKTVWATDLTINYETNHITIDKGLVQTSGPAPGSSSSGTENPGPQKSRSAFAVSTYSESKARVGSDPTKPDTEKPNWLDNHGGNSWSQVTVNESLDEWRERNASRFARWERAYPDKSKYEKWGWDFPSREKELAYQQALKDAQAEIEAEYQAAVKAEENKVRAQMRTLGAIEIAKHSDVTNFEGEVDPNLQFLYGRDYYMGDIVQIVDAYGFHATARVTSIILSEEEGEGFKVLPSFESDDASEVWT